MKSNVRLAVWVGIPVLLIGLLLGVAIGRSRTPFGMPQVLSGDAPTSEGVHLPDPPTSISVGELKQLLESGQPVTLIDVREADEYAALHIPNSKSIPLGAIWARQAEIPQDHPVVVYCSSDLRGEIAARELGKLGFANVKYLDGGISAWQNAGLGIVH